MDQKTLIYLLQNHSPTSEEEITYKDRTLYFVAENKNFFSRENLKGHITGSAWILSPDSRQVLLIHHARLDKWFQPGGHTEKQDPTIYHIAFREAMEETGLKSISPLSPNIFDVDIHIIPEKGNVPEHLHYDIRFVFKATDKIVSMEEKEIKGIKWIDLEYLINANKIEKSLQRMALKSINNTI